MGLSRGMLGLGIAPLLADNVEGTMPDTCILTSSIITWAALEGLDDVCGMMGLSRGVLGLGIAPLLADNVVGKMPDT